MKDGDFIRINLIYFLNLAFFLTHPNNNFASIQFVIIKLAFFIFFIMTTHNFCHCFFIREKKMEMIDKIKSRETDLKNMFNELIKESEENEKKSF